MPHAWATFLNAFFAPCCCLHLLDNLFLLSSWVMSSLLGQAGLLINRFVSVHQDGPFFHLKDALKNLPVFLSNFTLQSDASHRIPPTSSMKKPKSAYTKSKDSTLLLACSTPLKILVSSASWSWTQHTQTQQLEVKMLEHFYWLQQESNVTFFWQLFLNRMLMFSTDGDRKEIQVPTLSDIQLLGIFKQREQVEQDRDNPLKLMEECHFKTFVLWL